MKARVKATGEIVDVTNLFDDGTAEIGENNYIKVSKIDMDLDGTDRLDIPSEQRMRYELTKTAMHAILTGDFYKRHTIRDDLRYRGVANEAINIADEIIKQLKERQDE